MASTRFRGSRFSFQARTIAQTIRVRTTVPTTFAQAIALAKEKVKDGKPFEIELEEDDGKSLIEVELLAGDKVMEVEIDAATGKVLSVEEEKE